MSTLVLQIAKTIGNLTSWNITNLKLQKLAYLSHMHFLGMHSAPLVDETFQAWNYGPVLPSLYKKLRIFGSEQVSDCLYGISSLSVGKEFEVIKDVVDNYADLSAGQLVALTHREGGAWDKNYKPYTKDIAIPNTDILHEYKTYYNE